VRDGDAEEVMHIAEVRHGKLGVESRHDALQEGNRRRCKDDVVDVQEQVGGGIPLFENKERRVGDGSDEAEEHEIGGEPLVPGPRSLFQGIQRAL
jgi:hypothetical protein